MHWLLGGYMWLFVHRPFEIYTVLGDLQIERIYVIVMLLYWLVWPDKRPLGNRLHVALAAFAFALVLCWTVSPYRDQGDLVVESFAKVLVFYALLVTSVHDERGLRRVLALYLTAVGLYMAHSMLEYAHGRYEWRMGVRRMIGVDMTYRDPNAFAANLLLAISFTLPFWMGSPTRRQKLALAAFTAAASLCILLTGSRGGFIGWCLFGVSCALLSRYRARILPLVLVVAPVALVALPGDLQNRFLTIIDPSYGPKNAQQSGEGRLVGLTIGLQLFGESPLVGVGPGSFPVASGLGFNPHNLYGQVLGEMGLCGAGSLLFMLACFLLNYLEARRIYRRHPGWAHDFPFYVARAGVVGVLLLLFQGCAGHNLYRFHWQWFAAFQAVALHCIRQRSAAQATLFAFARGPGPLPYLAGRPAPRASPRPG
jgi:O-antigen ligase